MGNTWRIGVNPAEKTTLVQQGPYRVIRHPIYAFQILMLAGGVLLLPTVVSGVTLVLHYVCILIKAQDEEAYLLTVHGATYRDYLGRTGRLIPKVLR
jgi:protein-S-isoprenylcysteine O-methyltransferase Ste14